MDRIDVSDSLRDMLELVTGFGIGLCEVPAGLVKNDLGLLIEPYAIVSPIPSSYHYGSLADPEAFCGMVYQVTSVGRDVHQSQWMSDACRRAIIGRNPSGEFIHPIVTVDAVIIDRSTSEEGGPEPGGGGLWQTVSTFHLEVNAT